MNDHLLFNYIYKALKILHINKLKTRIFPRPHDIIVGEAMLRSSLTETTFTWGKCFKTTLCYLAPNIFSTPHWDLANKKVKLGDQMVHQDTLKSKKIPGIVKDSAHAFWPQWIQKTTLTFCYCLNFSTPN